MSKGATFLTERGVIYADRFVKEGEHVKFDDELVLHLTKDLRNAEKPS